VSGIGALVDEGGKREQQRDGPGQEGQDEKRPTQVSGENGEWLSPTSREVGGKKHTTGEGSG